MNYAELRADLFSYFKTIFPGVHQVIDPLAGVSKTEDVSYPRIKVRLSAQFKSVGIDGISLPEGTIFIDGHCKTEDHLKTFAEKIESMTGLKSVSQRLNCRFHKPTINEQSAMGALAPDTLCFNATIQFEGDQ